MAVKGCGAVLVGDQGDLDAKGSSPVMVAAVRYRDFFHGMYTWLSGLCDEENRGTLDEIHRFCADDGRIITCGQVKAAGVEELRKHFGIYPRQYEEVESSAAPS
ncbi:hypothetical protein ACFWP5_42080 [Streptomyces sp. NPDC058469]|uniref:hypothetical protein n=1 Tax=Streptomyces sp. NPDC058469 TaxID=3346514 RepID=UPI0036605684